MFTIGYLCDKAKKNSNLKSDNFLGYALGLSGSAISAYRTNKAFPNDETMIKLAALADVDTDIALVALSYWRTKGETQTHWRKLYESYLSHARIDPSKKSEYILYDNRHKKPFYFQHYAILCAFRDNFMPVALC